MCEWAERDTATQGAAHISRLLRAQVRYFKCKRAVCALIMEATRSFFPGASTPHRECRKRTTGHVTKFPSCNGEHSWWLLSNDKCLRSATARTLWKKGESSAPSVFHAFLGAICERALNLYVCRGGALWLAYHRTQTQSATQWECLFNPSTDIDSYYSYDTRTRQKCFIRTGYSFQPSIRLNSNRNYLHSEIASKFHGNKLLLCNFLRRLHCFSFKT